MPDTLTDRIERHEALAEAAAKNLSPLDAEIVKGVLVGDPLANHIAANDPATIKAFCAVAKAAEDYVHSTGTAQEIEAALAALYDALGGGR